MSTLVHLLKAIADDKSLLLFNTIANSNGDTDILSASGLSRKQYYSRLSTLLNVGVVKRLSGKYSLTACGVVLYHAQELIGKAVNQYWKLKAIDSITESGKGELPQEQFCLIIDKLLANQEIKDILLKHFKGESSVYKNQEPAISV
ncbi:MAG: hypothetical protein WA364_20440 [Candidatus Nitrosopolaris sp.]